MNTCIDWGAAGVCHLKRPKCQTHTNITVLVLTDHWSLALCFPSDNILPSLMSPLLSQEGSDMVGGLEFSFRVT
jgi:hypothetical protein